MTDSELPPAHDHREWYSFEHDDETYQFDLTFLTSRWTCIYGAGCPGIEQEPGPEAAIGCCTHGAYFSDKFDRRRVREAAERLEPGEWQLEAEAEALGGAIGRNEDGDWVTHTYDGACIFLNRADAPTGPGCALHQAAVRRGERPLDWKPTVCWQVPVRLEYHRDETGHDTTVVRDWKRRDWGEGGADFHWWCTEEPVAYVGRAPVYVQLADELEALVGAEPYRLLVEHLEGRARPVALPDPTLTSRRQDADRDGA